MILTRAKAISLFQKLNDYCKENHLKVKSKSCSSTYIGLARIIMQRYNFVILVNDNHDKFLCHNPKYLKKWALQQSLKHISPISYK